MTFDETAFPFPCAKRYNVLNGKYMLSRKRLIGSSIIRKKLFTTQPEMCLNIYTIIPSFLFKSSCSRVGFGMVRLCICCRTLISLIMHAWIKNKVNNIS